MKTRMAIIALLFACALPMSAFATTYGFGPCISNNNPASCAAFDQFFVDVTAVGDQVLFKFTNIGDIQSIIADIYFDDGSLAGVASITGSTGVSFSEGANPADLPAGNNAIPPFVATFSADADSPVDNGINNTGDEWLEILFDLDENTEIGDVLADLESGALRIGIHVQGFANGMSETFINDGPGPGPEPIPEPATLLLLGSGLAGLGLAVWRRKN